MSRVDPPSPCQVELTWTQVKLSGAGITFSRVGLGPCRVKFHWVKVGLDLGGIETNQVGFDQIKLGSC